MSLSSPSQLLAPTSPPPTVRRSWFDRSGLIVGVALVLLGLLALGTTLFVYQERQVGSLCGDGWISDSTQPGRCSSHDGVAENLFEDTPFGVSPESWINVSPWRLGLGGVISFGAGGALVTRQVRRRDRTALPASSAVRPSEAHDAPPPSLGVLELTARVHKGGAGRVIEISVDNGPITRMPFFFRNDQGRAAPRLAELMRTTKKRRFGRSGRGPVEDYGTELFSALFQEPIGSRYREALAVAHQTNSRLRILLDLDQRTGDLPWEYLYDAERASFLAMSKDTSVIRVVNDGGTTRACAPIERLRVLVMTASPRGLPRLDVNREVTTITDRLANVSGSHVDVHYAEGDTLEDLRQALNAHEPHVFHFVGHGHWDEADHEGAVIFADTHGGQSPVTGRDLGVVLNRPGLRLVLFNSCNAARTSQADRFAGVAGSLVAQGVPAAIGMQYPIEDRSAASFGAEFLALLAAGHSIGEALSEARTAVYTTHNGIEWGTPVMTTRVPVDEIIPSATGLGR